MPERVCGTGAAILLERICGTGAAILLARLGARFGPYFVHMGLSPWRGEGVGGPVGEVHYGHTVLAGSPGTPGMCGGTCIRCTDFRLSLGKVLFECGGLHLIRVTRVSNGKALHIGERYGHVERTGVRFRNA